MAVKDLVETADAELRAFFRQLANEDISLEQAVKEDSLRRERIQARLDRDPSYRLSPLASERNRLTHATSRNGARLNGARNGNHA